MDSPSACLSASAASCEAFGRDSNVYISLPTTSVSSPIERAKSSVDSKMGGRISPKWKVEKTSRAVCSTWFQSAVSGGRRSRVPLMAWNLDLLAIAEKRRSPQSIEWTILHDEGLTPKSDG